MRIALVVSVVVVVAGCGVEEPELSATPQHLVTPPEGQSVSWQGADWQGSDWQGSDWQGSDWQGSDWQGTSLDNVTLGSSSVVDATVSRSVLKVWKLRTMPFGWEERFPDKICYWNFNRTIMSSCTQINLATAPSPLAGTNWIGTFRRPNGETFQSTIRIGTSVSAVGAVNQDTKVAMSALRNHVPAPDPCDTVSCSSPGGCRKNCDLWLYDIRMVELLDDTGQPKSICPAGHQAMAIEGTYAHNAEHDTTDPRKFTFVCTSGTVAKCTRWGYRPFGSASKTYKTWPYASLGLFDLAPFHQACVRGAMADYCAKGDSYTRNGTLIDISDTDSDHVGYSIIHKGPEAPALVWESTFDRYGAAKMDHIRYTELGGPRGPPSFMSTGCIDWFIAAEEGSTWNRTHPMLPSPTKPFLHIESTPACAHSEHTVGTWLHRDCSACTDEIDDDPAFEYCTDPTSDQGWDASCVARAQSCTGGRMTIHSECAIGAGLSALGSGCTMKVCSIDSTCCANNKFAWTASCVATANAQCTGGRESTPSAIRVGFCGTVY